MSEKEISSFQRKIYKCIRGFIYISTYTGVYIISKTKQKEIQRNKITQKKKKMITYFYSFDLLHRYFSPQNKLHIFIMV